MPGETTADLQLLIERLQAGDAAAKGPLLERAVQRLRRLADAIVRQSFPGLRGHEDTVFQETALRLWQALDAVPLDSAQHFYRLIALKVRQVLYDLIARHARTGPPPGAEATATHDPARLAQWTEFHRAAEALPADQRAVFDLCYYAGLTQAEAARALEQHPRAVSRLWVAATESLLHLLPGEAD